MGFSIKFNWVLQVEPPESLTVKCLYPVKKSEYRIFPLDTPIDLIDLKRAAIAKIRIKSFSNESGSTSGVYEVLKIYADTEKAILTNYWIENETI